MIQATFVSSTKSRSKDLHHICIARFTKTGGIQDCSRFYTGVLPRCFHSKNELENSLDLVTQDSSPTKIEKSVSVTKELSSEPSVLEKEGTSH